MAAKAPCHRWRPGVGSVRVWEIDPSRIRTLLLLDMCCLRVTRRPQPHIYRPGHLFCPKQPVCAIHTYNYCVGLGIPRVVPRFPAKIQKTQQTKNNNHPKTKRTQQKKKKKDKDHWA